MRVLVTSHDVLPHIGGVELITDRFVEDLLAHGAEVALVTHTRDPLVRPDVRVHVSPGRRELWRLIRSADLVFQNQVSLGLGLPLLASRTPCVISLHNWLGQTPRARLIAPLKQLFLYRARRVFACSQALADTIWRPATVVHPGYDEAVFDAEPGLTPGPPPSRDVAFVGRLSTGKGIVDLITAFAALVEHHRPHATLTVIGDGEERAALEADVERRGLAAQVRFLGQLTSTEIAAELRDHRCLVVPSRLPEPFGMVALEGLASGCTVITSNQGGLPEAHGGLGLVFPNGDTGALEALMARALSGGAGGGAAERAGHLSRNTTAHMLDAYRQACLDVARRSR